MNSISFKYRLRALFPFLFIITRGIKLLYSKRSFLNQSGYLNSIRLRRPCRNNGSYLPWMNYQMIAFLEQRLNNDMTLFEYGSGYSTLFFASLVKQVTAVEHNKNWFDIVSDMKPDTVNLIYQPIEDIEAYTQAAGFEKRLYDIIVIDGRERIRCAQFAVNLLTEPGVIIFDDSSRTRYKKVEAFFGQSGFKKLDFIGLKPGGITCHQTSIYYRNNNCLGL